MNKPVYLGMTILDISKALICEFQHSYVKPKYEDNAKLCYMDRCYIERWFDTFNYDKNYKRPLPMGINKKVIGMFKGELGGKIMKEFFTLRAKTYSHLMEDDSEMKKAKRTKKCVIKRRLLFGNYKDSLFNNKTIMRLQLRFKSNHHNVYTEEVNKIARYSNDDKRLQTFDRVTTYPYGTNVFKEFESEMMIVRD